MKEVKTVHIKTMFRKQAFSENNTSIIEALIIPVKLCKLEYKLEKETFLCPSSTKLCIYEGDQKSQNCSCENAMEDPLSFHTISYM